MSNLFSIGGAGNIGASEGIDQQSLKFNDDRSQYLSWTPETAGNRRTWTWSGWVKRGNLGVTVSLMDALQTSGTDWTRFHFNSSDKLAFAVEISNSNIFQFVTTQVFRDTSAWYHIVAAYDSTQATSTNRFKLYVNGEQITAFDTETYGAQNTDSHFTSTIEHNIGAVNTGIWFFDGYMSDIHFIDGQALDASSFGETVDGYWKAKDYSGTYGTNGFRLTFEDDVVSEGFNAVTYRGNDATNRISGLGFSPDLVWLKNRDVASTHRLHNSLTYGGPYDAGATGSKYLASNSTAAENASSANALISLDADGFSVHGTGNDSNDNGEGYVAWAWDAGSGSAASNTDGTITSTVKANPDYGFSIASYTGTGSAATIGHGLGVAPDLVIVKCRSNAISSPAWPVWHKDLASTAHYLDLQTTAASASAGAALWNNTAPTSSVFSVGTTSSCNSSGFTYISYCFAEVAGYSSISSYTGTGTSNSITTGFEPAFVMIKRDGGANWAVYDNTRNASNPNNLQLFPNTSDDENVSSNNAISFDSDGFTLLGSGGTSNNNGDSYLFYAVADTREAAFWKDVSGQGNHWTPNNLDYRDSVIDSPANNWCTLNPLFRGTSNNRTISEGNLKYQATSDDFMAGTFGVSSGKYYFEIFVNDIERSNNYFGIALETNRSNTEAVYYRSGSAQLVDALGGSTTQTVTDAVDGDIISIAVDLDGGSVQFKLNNSDLGTAISLQSGTYVPFTGNGNSTAGSKIWTFNFGQDSTFSGATTAGGNQDDNGVGDFKYAPPSGYLALCTANLPEPTIVDGSEYFNTVLYTGNGSTQSITGVGFGSAPDFVWIKERSSTSGHSLFDVIRGAGEYLGSHSTAAEATSTTQLTSFDADGFTTGASGGTNQSGQTYAAWNWKAGGTAVSNTAGSITSQVSANTTAGFSIVSYTGDGNINSTVGHGLGKAPSMVIVKARGTPGGSARDWVVKHIDNTAGDALVLNSTQAETGPFGSGNVETFSTDTFGFTTYSTGTNNVVLSGEDYIAYCFANSDTTKVGSYTGNGSSDGPFVFTGFRPAFWMMKSVSDATHWVIYDSARETFNAVQDQLLPNEANAEAASGRPVDFLSNGVKIRFSSYLNDNGQTYIYLAFAENPFKYANAR